MTYDIFVLRYKWKLKTIVYRMLQHSAMEWVVEKTHCCLTALDLEV